MVQGTKSGKIMPITAEDAILKTSTLELNEVEKKWFDRLCQYTDILITNHFDGESVNVGFENMFYNNSNYGWQPYSIACWRQVVVVNVWITTYEKIGWKISPKGQKWSCNSKHHRYSEYKFEPDIRDIKIKKILDEV
jgi:hypothetical protein